MEAGNLSIWYLCKAKFQEQNLLQGFDFQVVSLKINRSHHHRSNCFIALILFWLLPNTSCSEFSEPNHFCFPDLLSRTQRGKNPSSSQGGVVSLPLRKLENVHAIKKMLGSVGETEPRGPGPREKGC